MARACPTKPLTSASPLVALPELPDLSRFCSLHPPVCLTQLLRRRHHHARRGELLHFTCCQMVNWGANHDIVRRSATCTSARPASSWATAPGSCTCWSMDCWLMAAPTPTRKISQRAARTRPSSPRRAMANTCLAPSSSTWTLLCVAQWLPLGSY
jgi:hypothetical protein